MSEAAVFLGSLFALCMMGIAATLFVKGARETFDLSPHQRPTWMR